MSAAATAADNLHAMASVGEARAEQEQLFEGAAPRLAGQVRLRLSCVVSHSMQQHLSGKSDFQIWSDVRRLAAKEAMLTRLGATLTALHEQHTALTQVSLPF